MNKFRDWLEEADTCVYINDEGDEIISEYTNGEFLFGVLGGFVGLFIIILVGVILK